MMIAIVGMLVLFIFFFFFFKQKTAYEMRISDWSSDVCSSDLLTIDVGLQEYVAQRLAVEQSAAAVIMDVHRGDIYALSSSPGYDPNLFSTGIRSADRKSVV